MTQKIQRKAIRIANKTVGIPVVEYRKVQQLLKQGRKIDAVVIIREHARAGVRDAKRALENPANFEQPSKDQAVPQNWAERIQWLCEQAWASRCLLIEKPRIVSGTAIILLLLGGMLVSPSSSEASQDRYEPVTWYYDLNEGELFATVAAESPITAPSDEGDQRSGVRAFVLSCGACGDGERYVGYLEKFTDKAWHASGQLDAAEPGIDGDLLWAQLSEGRLIRKAESDKWVRYDSPKGQEIRRDALSQCSPNYARPCHP
jgi:hypothetical protein